MWPPSVARGRYYFHAVYGETKAHLQVYKVVAKKVMVRATLQLDGEAIGFLEEGQEACHAPSHDTHARNRRRSLRPSHKRPLGPRR